MKKIICVLFGHQLSDEPFWDNNNLDYCARCKEVRSPYQTDKPYFTFLEWYGWVGYPLYKIKTFSQTLWYLYYKIKRKINYKKDSDVPF